MTYGGSLRMEDKVFTTDLYNPNSVQFKEMETYVCDMVSTRLGSIKDMQKYVCDMVSGEHGWRNMSEGTCTRKGVLVEFSSFAFIFLNLFILLLQLEFDSTQDCMVTRFRWVLQSIPICNVTIILEYLKYYMKVGHSKSARIGQWVPVNVFTSSLQYILVNYENSNKVHSLEMEYNITSNYRQRWPPV